MALTEEQLAFWNEYWPGEWPEAGKLSQQTPQQAENFAVMSLQYAFQFEGLDVPSEADVRAELRKRYGAVGTANGKTNAVTKPTAE